VITILLVEDDRFLRRAAEACLTQRGFRVLTAVDGEEGLATVRRERPDLVLLDLLMPRRSGLEVLRALRGDDELRGVRVIVMSNCSREEDVREVILLGALAYWVKADISLRQLGDRVEAVFVEETMVP
jgi:DNA-binding response OmpR family regulator